MRDGMMGGHLDGGWAVGRIEPPRLEGAVSDLTRVLGGWAMMDELACGGPLVASTGPLSWRLNIRDDRGSSGPGHSMTTSWEADLPLSIGGEASNGESAIEDVADRDSWGRSSNAVIRSESFRFTMIRLAEAGRQLTMVSFEASVVVVDRGEQKIGLEADSGMRECIRGPCWPWLGVVGVTGRGGYVCSAGSAGDCLS